MLFLLAHHVDLRHSGPRVLNFYMHARQPAQKKNTVRAHIKFGLRAVDHVQIHHHAPH